MIPSTLDEACAQIDSLAELAHGWNSHQAAAIAFNAIYKAKQILRASGEVPDGIVPTSTGGVQIEWHSKNFDLEIEIKADETLSYAMEHQHVPTDKILAVLSEL